METNIFKQSVFWQRFVRFLLIGLSVWLLTFTLQASPTTLLASHACVSVPAAVNISTPVNNQTFPANTSSVTVIWNQDANVDSSRIRMTDNHTNTIIASTTVTTNSFTTPALQNGHSFTVLIVPGNRCGEGAGRQVSFTIASVPPIGQLSCSISQRLLGPSGNGFLFELIGSSGFPNIKSWEWFTVNNGANRFNTGQFIQQQFFANATVRLVVTDTENRSGSCETAIVLPTTLLPPPPPPVQCFTFTATEQRCMGNQLCSVNITQNVNNICGNRAETAPFNCSPAAQCGFVLVPPPAIPPLPPLPVQLGNLQQTTVGVANANSNVNSNFNSSSASAGAGGSTSVTITW
ncbi:MAG: hypothetical protein HYW45_02655 [Candidatus Daviesbacteria bacterium]|nr:MAG: hypothetical protein HYW45_02655 [Candidatus Daviesbacteria bacterium]